MKNINLDRYNVKTDLKKEFNEAKKDDTFKKVISEINIDEEELIKYTTKLKQVSCERKNCENCPGLAVCKNEIPGFKFKAKLENDNIIFAYDTCNLKQDNLDKIEYLKKGYLFEVSKDVRNAKMKDIYTDDKNRVDVIKWLTKFIKDYDNKKAYKGLYLSGNFGSGKSYLVSAAINELVKKGYTAALVYYPDFLRSLKSSFNSDFIDQFEYARKADLLLLDDIGAESISSWSRDEILGPILQYRMDEKLPTFFTSNLSLEELEVHLSESKDKIDKVKAKRIIERIKFLTDNLTLISENKRN